MKSESEYLGFSILGIVIGIILILVGIVLTYGAIIYDPEWVWVGLLALAFGHEPDEFGLTTHLQYMQRKNQPNWERLGIKAKV